MKIFSNQDQGGKPVLGIDLDGVLVDTDYGWQEYFGKKFCGLEHPARPTTDGWDKWKVLCRKCWDDVLHTPDIITSHPIMPGAHAALVSLSTHFRLLALTSRNAIDGPWTKQWLEDHGIMDLFETVIHFDDKNLILTSYNAVAHIDDSPDKLEKLAETKVLPIIFDQPYNQMVTNGVRVMDWKEAAIFLIEHFIKKEVAV